MAADDRRQALTLIASLGLPGFSRDETKGRMDDSSPLELLMEDIATAHACAPLRNPMAYAESVPILQRLIQNHECGFITDL